MTRMFFMSKVKSMAKPVVHNNLWFIFILKKRSTIVIKLHVTRRSGGRGGGAGRKVFCFCYVKMSKCQNVNVNLIHSGHSLSYTSAKLS